MKKFLVLLVCVGLLLAGGIRAEETMFKGHVKGIAEDGSHFMMDQQKIWVDHEQISIEGLEMEDWIEVTVEKTDQGMVLKDYQYLVNEGYNSEVDSSDSYPTND